MKFTPYRITIIYFVFAVLWITTTDQLLEWAIDDLSLLSQLQTAKGLFYITLTAIGLYLMMKSYENYIAKSKKKLEKNERSLSLALSSAKMGVWEYFVEPDKYITSENHHLLFDIDPKKDIGLEDVYKRLHPDHYDEFKKHEYATLLNGDDFNIQYRVIHRDGGVRWLWTKAEPHLVNGRVDRVSGVTIDITENKGLEEQFERGQELQKKIFENIPVMITVYRPDISDITVNDEFKKVTGWSNNDIEGVDLMREVYPDETLRQDVELFMSNPGSGWKDFPITTRDGKIVETSWTNIMLSDDTQVGIGIDISERKRLETFVETERKKLQKIYDSMPVFINLHDDDMGIAEVNKYFEDKLGYTNEEIKNKDILKLITTDEGYKVAKREIGNLDGKWVDHEMITKQGEKIYTTWTNIRISDSLSLGIGLDITERKIIEDKLKENEEWLQLTTNSADIGKWEWNPSTGETKFDEIWAKLVGYTLDELQPVSIETWYRLLHPDDYNKFEVAYREYIDGKKPLYECEVRMKHKEGHWVWILDRGKAIDWDKKGTPTRLVGTHIDISDRIAYEESLAYQASLMANVSDAVISVDKELVVTSWNRAAEEIYGWKAEEVLGKKLASFLKTIYETGVTGDIAFDELASKGHWQGEVIQKTKEGEEKVIYSSMTVIVDSEGEISDIVSVNRNITDRKKYERENRLLANVFIRSNTALSVSNHKTNKLERVNEAYANLFGYKIEEMIGFEIHSLYSKDQRKDIDQKVAVLNKKGFISFERKLKRKDGSFFDGIVNLSLVEDQETGETYRISTIQDISELKEIQEQLLHERHRFEMAANNVSDVVWEWNPIKNELWWGEGIEVVMGYKKEDYEGDLNFWKKKIYEEDRERVLTSMDESEKNPKIYHWESEYRFLAADESIRNVKDSAVLIRDDNGHLLRIIGAMVDVTQMLEFQNALQRERNRFELIAKSSNDVLYDYNLRTGEVWWSEGWQTRFGYKEKDVVNNVEWWMNRMPPDENIAVHESVLKAVESGSDFWVGRYRFLNGKDEYRNVIDKGFFIRDESGIPTHLVGTISDITADIEYQENLKSSEEQYRLLFKQSPLPMYIYDPETLLIVTANTSSIEKYEYSEEELVKMKIYELHPESDQIAIKKEIADSLKKKKTGFDMWLQVTKSGKKIIAEISGSEIYYNGKTHRLVIANDVTEQKQAEERAISAIVEGEERERQRIAKELHDGLGQYLSAANMNLETVYEDAKGLPDSLSKTFSNGLSLLNYAISETRNISQNLLPKAIQDYGLELALEALTNQLRGSSDVKFHLYTKMEGINLSENIQINLYRIAQEAINNALKHGSPKKVNVQLVNTGLDVLLTIEDDGSGFVVEKEIGKGIGLQSMKTRVGAMSANLDIVSDVGRGTIISVVVPLNELE
jgi:PAS domain S-box-containing protein